MTDADGVGGPGMAAEDDLVPVSVQLGTVVPPEDPEDWTRPLTWLAAAGMLAGPLLALAWFVVAPPASSALQPGMQLLAVVLATGAVVTGSTQQGAWRAFAATVAAAMFGALAIVLVGVLMAGERQVGAASPSVALAFGAAIAGLGGAVAAAPLAARFASVRARLPRVVGPGPVAAGVALLLLPFLFGSARL